MWIVGTIHGIQLGGNELARNENKQKILSGLFK